MWGWEHGRTRRCLESTYSMVHLSLMHDDARSSSVSALLFLYGKVIETSVEKRTRVMYLSCGYPGPKPPDLNVQNDNRIIQSITHHVHAPQAATCPFVTPLAPVDPLAAAVFFLEAPPVSLSNAASTPLAVPLSSPPSSFS